MLTRRKEKIYLNKTQLVANLVDCQTDVNIVARGEGKTEFILANKVLQNVKAMPRGVTVLCTPTYEGLLTKTLPPLLRGLKRLNVHKDYHFLVGKQPEKKWNWPTSYHEPLSWQYAMPWCNGHTVLFASFNRDNSTNGLSGHAVIVDEAKFFIKELKRRLFEELSPAIRGQREIFGKSSRYLSYVFTTDMPTNPESKWLFDYEEKMDKDVIDVIIGLQIEKIKLQQQDTDRARKAIIRINRDLEELRTGSVFYYEPKGLENLAVLGEERYYQWKRDLPENVFRTSILNERMLEVEDGFYPNLDDEYHGYWDEDPKLERIAFSSNFDVNQLKQDNCLHDHDIITNKPLDVAVDWGHNINCLVVGQQVMKEYRFVNSLYVKKPQKIQDLAAKFCTYYKHHRDKTIYLPFDQTAIGGHGAFNTTYLEEFTNVLRKSGWTVIQQRIGQTAPHEFRYLLWNSILQGRDPRFPEIKFNRKNCEYLLISMHQAPAKNTRRGFEKAKDSERPTSSTPQEEATHFSDAADTLAVYKFGNKLTQRFDSSGGVVVV